MCFKDFFQVLQHMAQYVDKNYSSELSQKILFWAKWEIFAWFCPNIMQVYITGSPRTTFLKTLL